MANVCVMNHDLWSSFHNQAGLSFNKFPAIGFSYENRFGIKELGTRAIALSLPAGKVSLGALYSYFGYSDFRRQMTGIACGMPLSGDLRAGVMIDYFSEKTYGEYNRNQMITCEAGVIITASENIMVGIHIFNPVPNSIRRSDMPTELRAGASVNLGKGLIAGVETGMCSGHNISVSTGFEYEAAKNLMIRGGFSTTYNSFSFGIGYHTSPAIIDFAFSTHERLGISTTVSLIFELNSNKRKGS